MEKEAYHDFRTVNAHSYLRNNNLHQQKAKDHDDVLLKSNATYAVGEDTIFQCGIFSGVIKRCGILHPKIMIDRLFLLRQGKKLGTFESVRQKIINFPTSNAAISTGDKGETRTKEQALTDKENKQKLTRGIANNVLPKK